jgi:hypothetical protein
MILTLVAVLIGGTSAVVLSLEKSPHFKNSVLQKYYELYQSKARTPKDHLLEHEADLRACKSAFSLLTNDDKFKDVMRSADSMSPLIWINALKASKYSGHPSVKYLIENSSRFEIDADFHHTYSAASIEEIFCRPFLHIRMMKIEELGESPQGWTIRKIALNRIVENLDYPCNNELGGFISFEMLYNEILEAKNIYHNSQRAEFTKWLTGAVGTLADIARTQKFEIGAAGEAEAVECRKTVLSWSSKLQKILK